MLNCRDTNPGDLSLGEAWFIDHTQYEFTSFLKLAEVNFRILSLGTRDVGASKMMNSFDFNQPPPTHFDRTSQLRRPSTIVRDNYHSGNP